MSNDNFNLDWEDASLRDTIPLNAEPLRVAIVSGEILISTTGTPSLTADAAELTGRRLIEAALDLREQELILSGTSSGPAALAVGRTLRLA